MSVLTKKERTLYLDGFQAGCDYFREMSARQVRAAAAKNKALGQNERANALLSIASDIETWKAKVTPA